MKATELNKLIDKVMHNIHIQAMGSTRKTQIMEDSVLYTIPKFNGVTWYAIPAGAPGFKEIESGLLDEGFVPLGRLENGIIHSRIHAA